MTNKNFILFLKFLLIILSVISLGRGIFNASVNSQDFNYSPAVMTWNGINHYQYLLNKDPPIITEDHYILNEGLFILLYPFTLMTWSYAKFVWMAINVFLAFFLPIFFVLVFFLAAGSSGPAENNLLKNCSISPDLFFYLSFSAHYDPKFAKKCKTERDTR